MGGMLTQEYAFFGPEYVRTIVPIATSGRHSAWGISWGEAQRQSIYSDPKYDDGYYTFEDPPSSGLGAARMAALLTYRSRDSFERRFGRNTPDPSKRQTISDSVTSGMPTHEHWAVHNDGHRNAGSPRPRTPSTSASATATPPRTPHEEQITHHEQITLPEFTDPQFSGARPLHPPTPPTPITERKRALTSTYFSAQSYLRYQGDKFVNRFDSNCYIAITRKLDTHDVSRNRTPLSTSSANDNASPVRAALSLLRQPALVLGIESDGLFTFAEQVELAQGIPDSRLHTIDSPEGHDAFLLQFEQVNRYILEFFRETLGDIMNAPAIEEGEQGKKVEDEGGTEGGDGVGKVEKESTFGEAEVEDITAW